jgi:hypothetical protein
MTGEQAMTVIEAGGLGKRYGTTWALRECSLAVPAGLQWIEGGWLLALSLLLIAATVWLVHRRAT